MTIKNVNLKERIESVTVSYELPLDVVELFELQYPWIPELEDHVAELEGVRLLAYTFDDDHPTLKVQFKAEVTDGDVFLDRQQHFFDRWIAYLAFDIQRVIMHVDPEILDREQFRPVFTHETFVVSYDEDSADYSFRWCKNGAFRSVRVDDVFVDEFDEIRNGNPFQRYGRSDLRVEAWAERAMRLAERDNEATSLIR